MKKITLLLCAALISVCAVASSLTPVPGAEQPDKYLPKLKHKRVAVVGNQTSMIGEVHLVDFLISKKIKVVAVFSPEHGFRGTADAGEHVDSSVDAKTGLPIRSLYDGDTGRPSQESLSDVDIVVFDLQDVGLRYYTYLTTMCKMMESCAAYGKEMIVLDRPNPNGHYVDGPILDMKYRSAVGWLPIPVVHGMTLGELALMVNGEKWLDKEMQCAISVIPCKHYTHSTLYVLPVAPSPNLRSMRAIYLYPSLCYFEATPVSLGRGTESAFQMYGHPNMKGYAFSFTPRSIEGAKTPPQLDKECWGVDLRTQPNDSTVFARGVDLSYVIDAYNNLNLGDHFFRPFFEKLIGVDYVRKLIKQGKSAEEIRASWQEDVIRFKAQRKPYLLYQD